MIINARAQKPKHGAQQSEYKYASIPQIGELMTDSRISLSGETAKIVYIA
jgi:hypothetical protein